MKVLMIKGSPHIKGSSNLLASQFIKGVQENHHEVTQFDVAHHHIAPCLGCEHCGMDGPCVQKDDMNELKDYIEGKGYSKAGFYIFIDTVIIILCVCINGMKKKISNEIDYLDKI